MTDDEKKQAKADRRRKRNGQKKRTPKKVTAFNITDTYKNHSIRHKIDVDVVRARERQGWDIEKALTTPVGAKGKGSKKWDRPIPSRLIEDNHIKNLIRSLSKQGLSKEEVIDQCIKRGYTCKI